MVIDPIVINMNEYRSFTSRLLDRRASWARDRLGMTVT
jgi:hypothetical protein